MSLWRAKRKHEANQGLNETADDALLAVTLLRNQSDDFTVYTEEDIEEYLRQGIKVLDNLKQGVQNPSEVPDYYLVLVSHLRESGRKQTATQFEDELDNAIEALEAAAKKTDWQNRLEAAEKLLRRIEEFTSETSTRAVEDMREDLAHGPR